MPSAAAERVPEKPDDVPERTKQWLDKTVPEKPVVLEK